MKDTGLAKSTSEAIRLIKQGGVKLNGSTVTDTDTMLQQGGASYSGGKKKIPQGNSGIINLFCYSLIFAKIN